MKLGILCTMLNDFGKKGFYNSQEIGLGQQLSDMGHTVIIYKGVRKGEPFVEDKLADKLVIRYIPLPRFSKHGYIKTSWLDKDLNGLLCFSDQQLFIPHVYRFCVKHHISFVPYVGTTFSVYPTLRGKVMNVLAGMGTLRLYRHMPVLAKTESAKKELENLGAKDVTIAMVGLNPHVLRQDYRDFSKAELRKEFGFAADDVVLCCVARIEIDKRTDQLIEVLNRSRDKKPFRLLLVGKGPLRGQVDQKIREYSLEDRVRILDRVPFSDMWKIYRMSDYYINMSKEEIFGMAIMEAVYYGTSVAARRALGPSMTLKGMRGHCLCDSDDEVVNWICGPYPDEKDLEESAQKMIANFSWESCAKAFLSKIQAAR
ncbi:MAG: glycosyltransferase [Clostridia bacterium]|nr:glycosyltransferase [Clostridia bacterium]